MKGELVVGNDLLSLEFSGLHTGSGGREYKMTTEHGD